MTLLRFIIYFISCSRLSNSGEEKNSPKVMSSPSHSILIVLIVGLRLRPYKILFSDEGDKPEMVASLLSEIFLSPHKVKILIFIASVVFMFVPVELLILKI